jgi:hypothetical protein
VANLMVLNRLCDPESKLGVLRWVQTVALPDFGPKAVTHQQLLRSLDALMDHQDEVDAVVAGLLRPLIDQDLSVVFYDLTTIRSEGLSQQAGDVRQYGMAKEGLIARQFMLGVVQTAEGLPIYHEVFDGNTAETRTLLPTLTKVLERFPSVQRLVLVADRGLLSLDNLEALKAVRLASGKPLEFIVAVPGRRYNEFIDLLEPFHEQQCASRHAGSHLGARLERSAAGGRARSGDAATKTEQRNERIDALIRQADQWSGKLTEQDEGVKHRGRKLSDSGAKARFYHAVSEAHLSRILKVDLGEELFSYHIDDKAKRLAEMMDGKLLLVTNAEGLAAQNVIQRYKSLADIERGFKVLKSEIEIGPVYHRLPERIRAHASICFMALILHRVMRFQLLPSLLVENTLAAVSVGAACAPDTGPAADRTASEATASVLRRTGIMVGSPSEFGGRVGVRGTRAPMSVERVGSHGRKDRANRPDSAPQRRPATETRNRRAYAGASSKIGRHRASHNHPHPEGTPCTHHSISPAALRSSQAATAASAWAWHVRCWPAAHRS